MGATLCCGARASHCSGFSFCGAWALGTQASVVVARGLSSCGSWALQHWLSSCGTWAYLLNSMWDLPRPGVEPVSPALAGGFLTTVPPGKSLFWYLNEGCLNNIESAKFHGFRLQWENRFLSKGNFFPTIWYHFSLSVYVAPLSFV